jgi:hypothetical protein
MRKAFRVTRESIGRDNICLTSQSDFMGDRSSGNRYAFLFVHAHKDVQSGGGLASFKIDLETAMGSSPWNRLRIAVRAVVAGIIVLYAGQVPWSGIAGYPFLAGWNLRVLPGIPWAVVPMCVYLLLYCKYLNGWGWPRSSTAARRINLRANRLSGETWGMALFAGFIGLAALLPLLRMMSRLVVLPAEAEPITMPQGMPLLTLLRLSKGEFPFGTGRLP